MDKEADGQEVEQKPSHSGESDVEIEFPQKVNSQVDDNRPSPREGDIDSLTDEQIPREVVRSVESFMGMIQASSRSSNPLVEKFNDEHVDKYLDQLAREEDHQFELG